MRRLHLIRTHHYPAEFFFSVTNHGIGELRQRYGASASLVRRRWTPRGAREGAATLGADVDNTGDCRPRRSEPEAAGADVDGTDDSRPLHNERDAAAVPLTGVSELDADSERKGERKRGRSPEGSGDNSSASATPPASPATAAATPPGAVLDDLLGSISSLSFKPRNVR